jgi:hypothetical protein
MFIRMHILLTDTTRLDQYAYRLITLLDGHYVRIDIFLNGLSGQCLPNV